MTGVTSLDQKWIACGESVASERIADPTLEPTAEPSSAGPSRTATVFTPNEQVVAVIRSTPLTMGSHTADARGNVSVSWKVPVDIAMAEYTVTRTGQGSKYAVVVPFSSRRWHLVC